MPAPLVWFVDDDTQTAQDIIRYWQSLKHPSLRFRHFSTAREAWELLATGNERPGAIVVDGHLDDDEGEHSNGAGFVRRVRSCPEIPQPLLVGFSGDPYAVEDMERAGAQAGFRKSQVRPVFDYLANTLRRPIEAE